MATLKQKTAKVGDRRINSKGAITQKDAQGLCLILVGKVEVNVIRLDEEYGPCRAVRQSLHKLKRARDGNFYREQCALYFSSGSNFERTKG
jgi:hypothetical protein